ncbi:unnamed protein product [Acanthoscelides obtectus]|uniref:Odorant receptor n=1 Tax=Acanthoscelides obtectus TaxID=200917 RepID=A0A9P0PGZ3_ACAOB|nr:unnamed protein product [Acanthoscelides obtectus]CAK1655159.1 hypothetical protein AOBTE_LOCUS19051 [Acanthoscelides obtectus]
MERYDYLSLISPDIQMIRYMGFWSGDEPNSGCSKIWYKIYRSIILICLVMLLCLGWAYIPTHWDHITLGEVSTIICIYGMNIGNLSQVYFIIKNGKIFRNIMNCLESDRFQPKNFHQLEIAEVSKNAGCRIRKIFSIINYGGCMIWPLPVILGQEELLSISYVPPWCPTKVLCIFQIVCLSFYAAVMLMIVSLNCNLLLEIGIQVDILKDQIARSKGEKNAIVECIQHSGDLALLLEQVQYIQGFSLFFYFGTQVFIICTLTFSITDQMNPEEMAFKLAYMTSVIYMVYVMCWYGSDVAQKVTSMHSEFKHNFNTSYIPQ